MRYGMMALLLIAGGVVAEAGAGEVAAPVAASPDAGRVVAKVQGTEITYADLALRIRLLELERGPIHRSRYTEILRGMAREEVLFQAALVEKVEQGELVKGRLEQVRRAVIIDELLKVKLAEFTKISEDEVRRTYEQNKGQFTREGIRAAHIMLETEAEAMAVRQALRDGQAFGDLARTRSKDTGSAAQGGELGLLVPEMAEPEFAEAVSKLKDGEVSEVVKTAQGYHIIKALGREPVTAPLEEVKGQIRQALVQQKQREAVMMYITSLELGAKPEIFEDQLP